MRTLARGLLAGASGTAALNAVTYLDIAVRGRPPSTTPERSVRQLAARTGLRLGEGERAENRATGWGAVLGHLTGLGTACGYALVFPRPGSWPRHAIGLACLAMIAANAPLTRMGITDPRRWTATDWAEDVIPHLAYGAVAAATLRGLATR